MKEGVLHCSSFRNVCQTYSFTALRAHLKSVKFSYLYISLENSLILENTALYSVKHIDQTLLKKGILFPSLKSDL